MIAPRDRFEPRRRKQLLAELLERARVWLPDWRPRDDDSDFATALLEIAARLESEVTQRLDKVPEKVFRDFLYWLGVMGAPGRAGRLPVVFSMADGTDPVLSHAPVQLQATPAQTDTAIAAEPVIFETACDLMVSRGRLATIVAVNPSSDALFLPPAGFSPLEPPKAAPDAWKSASDVSTGATQLQLDPELGLDALPTIVHQRTRKQYRVTKADGALVTIEPPLEDDVAEDEVFAGSPAFDPFNEVERNRQEHALYIGSESVLNLPTEAEIAVLSLGSIGMDAEWSYWGKSGTADPIDWQTLEAPKFVNQQVVLKKPAGSVEIKEIGGIPSRWLRALKKPPVLQTNPGFSTLQLTVNCGTGTEQTPACPPAAADRSNIAVEAIANTTPLVLDIPFFPLGREPKLFDAFYIGSPEAFSKKNAFVQICLESVDSTTAALVAANVGDTGGVMFFGAGHGQLHRLRPTTGGSPIERLSAVRPPFSDNGIPSVPVASTAINDDTIPGLRLSAVTRQDDVVVAVTAQGVGWLWSQHEQAGQSQWYSLGPIFDPTAGPEPDFDEKDPPRILVLKNGIAGALRVIGINKGSLYEVDLAAGWESITVPAWKAVEDGRAPGDPPPTWTHIVPIFDMTKPLEGGNLFDGWIAVENDGVAVFEQSGTGSTLARSLPNLGPIDLQVAPLAIRTPDGNSTVIAQQGSDVVAWSVDNDQEIETLAGVTVHGTLDWVSDGSTALSVLFVRDLSPDRTEIAAWFPIDTYAGSAETDRFYHSTAFEGANGGPAVTADRIIVPGKSGAVISMPFFLPGLMPVTIGESGVESALVIASGGAPFAANDFVESKIQGDPKVVQRIAAAATQNGPGRWWLRLTPSKVDKPFKNATLYNRQVAQKFTGTVVAGPPGKTKFNIDTTSVPPDTHANDGYPYIAATVNGTISIHKIDSVDPPGAPTSITLDSKISGVNPPPTFTYEYIAPNTASSQILPLLDVQLLAANIVTSIVTNGAYVEGAAPSPNLVLFAHPPGTAPIEVLVLEDEWTSRPDVDPITHLVTLAVNAMFGPPTTVVEPKTGSPTLSWEYWDGTAWWKIQNLNDGTGNLQSTGTVKFCVPYGLQPTDVAGRTSHWIRARLIGGDYGQETVTITSKEDAGPPKVTTQTVERSLAGIKPPQYVSINLRYSVCCAAYPDFVLTKDGNAIRDQSAANKISDAIVEVFVPLADTIRRAASGSSTASDNRRAIYLGFDQKLEGGPIGVLFLVTEGTHDGAFPLELDVLREHGFERVIGNDTTRGLNETGVVSFTLSTPLPAVALFGSDARYWVRVRPNSQFSDSDWHPNIRAAFLNGVWAVAAETQGLERLGSSDGSPNQSVFLARPPVIIDTLTLRVREPLGDEEVDELRRADVNRVVDSLPGGQSGKWVIWDRVADPIDEEKDARVYALNHDTGEITFGDGQHGKIPPIGIDSIVAVRYQRGGGDAANRVGAWSQINLITPIPGVQTVAAPDGAAGGSDPQTAETVLRFAPANQFMRDRALTLRDLEMFSLQFSPDVAQVRAFPTAQGARIVVVMRGRIPQPSQAIRRELVRFLAGKTLPMLAAPDAIRIEGPVTVPIRLNLALAIERVDVSGAVSQDVNTRLRALLDPATGGLEGTGWRLGDVPTDAEVAAGLDGVKDLEELKSIEIVNADTGQSLTGLRPSELVVLAPEGVVSRFELSDEVPA